MAYRIEIGLRRGIRDARGRGIAAKTRRFLRLPVNSCQTRDVYKVDVALTPKEQRAVQKAFTDPVTSRSAIARLPQPAFDWMVEVGFKPGVTDNVGTTARAVVQDVLDRPLSVARVRLHVHPVFFPRPRTVARRCLAHRPGPAGESADSDDPGFFRRRMGVRAGRRYGSRHPRKGRHPRRHVRSWRIGRGTSADQPRGHSFAEPR